MRITIDLPENAAVELLLNFHSRLTNASLSTECRAAFSAAFEAIADELVKLRPAKADKIAEFRAELAGLHQPNHILTRKGLEASNAAADQMRVVIVEENNQ